jgi:hypothetical protein
LAADVIERAFKKNQIADSAGERAGGMLKAEHKL